MEPAETLGKSPLFLEDGHLHEDNRTAPLLTHKNDIDLFLCEEHTSLDSVVSACYHESRALSDLFSCGSKALDVTRAFDCASSVVMCDVHTQLFGLRKACSVLSSSCPPIGVWVHLMRSTCSVAMSFFFLSSRHLPIRCARYVVGGIYKNALHACILSEILDTVLLIVNFLRTPQSTKNFSIDATRKLAMSVGSIMFANTIPSHFLAGHLIFCICNALVDVSFKSMGTLCESHLAFIHEKLSVWRARVRLSPAVLQTRSVVEQTYEDEGDWTLSDLVIPE